MVPSPTPLIRFVQQLAVIGMGKDDGVAAIEFLEDRIEVGIAQPLIAVVRVHPHALELERVVHVLDLFQRGVNVRQGKKCEDAEFPRMIGGELGGKFVGRARNFIHRGRIVMRGNRGHGGGNAISSHLFQGFFGSPFGESTQLLGAHRLD